MRKLIVLAAALSAAVTLAPAMFGQGETLQGHVGPGFTITLTRANGSNVTQLDPGAYTVRVVDEGDEHNFHLTGPGVNRATDLNGLETVTWDVQFQNGRYTYLCDLHPTSMNRTFTVGTPPTTPPAVPTVRGSVGPGATIALRTAAGAKIRTLKPGKYKFAVRDRSKNHSFHLRGPGVNRKTGRPFIGRVTWTVTLRAASTYRYFSDANPKLKGSFRTL